MTKNAQDLLEDYHPRYYSSSEVAMCDILDRAVDGEEISEEDQELVDAEVLNLRKREATFTKASKKVCVAYLAESLQLKLFDAVASNILGGK